MKPVYFASKVSTLIGRNPYEPWAKEAARILQKHASPIAQILDMMEADTTTDNEKRNVQLEAKSIIEENKMAIEALVRHNKDTLQEESIQETTEKITTTTSSPMVQRVVQAEVQKAVFTARGTSMESSTFDRVNAQQVKPFHSRPGKLYRHDAGAFVIVGRLDGFNDETRELLEIKNRQRRLFRNVPLYEKIQVQCYLLMTGATKCKFVEQYQQEIWETDIFPDTTLQKEVVSSLEDVTRLIEATHHLQWINKDKQMEMYPFL